MLFYMWGGLFDTISSDREPPGSSLDSFSYAFTHMGQPLRFLFLQPRSIRGSRDTFLWAWSIRGSSFHTFCLRVASEGTGARHFLREQSIRGNSFDALFAGMDHPGLLRCICCARGSSRGSASMHFCRCGASGGTPLNPEIQLRCVLLHAEASGH